MRKAIAMFFVLLCARAACGQFADVSAAAAPVTINAAWRFHTGDDPAWASPNFDDSSWSLLSTDEFWSAQGYRGYTGYAWYRLRLKLPATTEPLAINIGHVNSAAEVYVDGQLIGANGIMRPKPSWSMQLTANAFPLPPALNGHSVEIAVRVWKSAASSSYSGGGFHSHPVAGSLALLQAGRRVAFDNSFAGDLSTLAVDLLTLVLGCFGLGLYLLDRRNTEYAWFAVWAIGTVFLHVLNITVTLRQGSVTYVESDYLFFLFPFYLAELLFLWGFVEARRDWMLWTAVLFDAVAITGNSLGYHGVISLPAGRAIMSGFFGLLLLLIIARVLLSLKAGNRDARLLIVPVCLMSLGIFIEEVRQAIFFAGWSRNRGELIFWSNDIVTVDWNDVFSVLYLMSIGFALMLRFTRSAQEERRLSAEMESAHQVQAQLVPLRLPATPQFRIEAAYLAAGEVGGDFYQVFPQSGGGVLVVIGDVSGKGLKAAMLGSQVVGALRSLAQESLHPAQILARLNQQLSASTDGGFVTCCVARVSTDGLLILANAGHLAPYRNGMELGTESGFPLGVIPGVTYAETSVTLEPGDRLTFLSDGVVEARNASGELFGFDRTASISTQSADQIARAAQGFGQEDDITVLTLSLAPAEVLHA
ncbi:MAG: SpoIIE family protein phosphatase [Terracidiphilus sp.]|jgi:hypothetical protein